MANSPRRRVPGGAGAADVATQAVIEWLCFGNSERPRDFRMEQAICAEIWRAELWALSSDDLERHYRQHHEAVDRLASVAGLSAPWVVAAIVEDRERERRSAAWRREQEPR